MDRPAAWLTGMFLACALAVAPADVRAQSEGQGRESEPEDAEGLPQYHRIFYIQPFVGYSWADAGAISRSGELVDAARASSSGWNLGGALGFKLLFFDLGARATYAFQEDFNLGAVMGDLGIRIPLPIFEPIVRFGVGYGWMDVDFEGALGNVLSPQIDGAMFEVGLGFDAWVGDHVTIGFDGALAFYFLSRGAIDCAAGRCPSDAEDVLSEDGDAGALQVRLQLTVGFWL